MTEHDPSLCKTCQQHDFDEFRHLCVHESIDLNEQLKNAFKITSWPRWDYEMDDATLIFSDEGKPQVICHMQVAGSTLGDTWQWSWSNPHTPMPCRSKLDLVHAFGHEKQCSRMTESFLPNDEFVGWECAGIANHLLGGIGVYRCPSSGSKRDDHLLDAVYVVILSAEFVH
jgi:hypothetical protein